MVVRVLVLLAVALGIVGCTTLHEAGLGQQMILKQRQEALVSFLTERGDELEHGALMVRLAFGSEADLDLYVTDPQLETVYFANRKAKSGGEISADARCGQDKTGLESVLFPDPLPGRYRVGIDYPVACDGSLEVAAHAVSVSYKGQNLEVNGQVSLQRFEVIVLEFEIDGQKLKEISQ